MRTKKHQNLRERSGCVDSEDKLVSFLYCLMRDHVVSGDIESIMADLGDDGSTFTNGYLAQHAQDIATRLKERK